MSNLQMYRTARFWLRNLASVNYKFLQRDVQHVNIVRFMGSVPYQLAVSNLLPVNYSLATKISDGDEFLRKCFQHQVRKFAKKAIVKESKGKGKQRKVMLTDEEMKEVFDLDSYHDQLQQIINKMKTNFAEHLSLHKLTGNVENLPVKIENEEYPLHELAKITRKNPNLVAIDMSGFPEGLKPALQAITESGMGVNPQQEGTMIYVPLPKITREHRERLAKNAKTIFTKSKDEIRTVQNLFIKEAKKQTELSEDLVFNSQQQIMHIAEQYASEAEKLLKLKQEELLPKS